MKNVKIGICTGLLVAVSYAAHPAPVTAGPACFNFQDWEEDDVMFDDKAHTGNLSDDPNIWYPAEEWYSRGTVLGVTQHHFFQKGHFTAGHGIHADC